MAALRLIVGLGNPGPRYEDTRHNAGAGFVTSLAERFGVSLSEDSKFKGLVGRGDLLGHDLRLLIPTTFMNDSGEAVAALTRFYKIACPQMLVAYDEMAFDPGQLRLKVGGGDNGHNGIRSIIEQLGGQRDFVRLRIGVGHPGDRSRVTAYLTSQRPPQEERDKLREAFAISDRVLAMVLDGDHQAAMNALHAPEDE